MTALKTAHLPPAPNLSEVCISFVDISENIETFARYNAAERKQAASADKNILLRLSRNIINGMSEEFQRQKNIKSERSKIIQNWDNATEILNPEERMAIARRFMRNDMGICNANLSREAYSVITQKKHQGKRETEAIKNIREFLKIKLEQWENPANRDEDDLRREMQTKYKLIAKTKFGKSFRAKDSHIVDSAVDVLKALSEQIDSGAKSLADLKTQIDSADIIIGKSRAAYGGLRATAADRCIYALRKVPELSIIANPLLIGAAASLVSWMLTRTWSSTARIIGAVAGGALAAGGIGALKKHLQIVDARQHAMHKRALGLSSSGGTATTKFAIQVEASLNNMVRGEDLQDKLQNALSKPSYLSLGPLDPVDAFKDDLTLIEQVRAKLNCSFLLKIDLIEWGDQQNLEKNKLELVRSLAALEKQVQEAIKGAKLGLFERRYLEGFCRDQKKQEELHCLQSVKQNNRVFAFIRNREVLKAAATSAAFGAAGAAAMSFIGAHFFPGRAEAQVHHGHGATDTPVKAELPQNSGAATSAPTENPVVPESSTPLKTAIPTRPGLDTGLPKVETPTNPVSPAPLVKPEVPISSNPGISAPTRPEVSISPRASIPNIVEAPHQNTPISTEKYLAALKKQGVSVERIARVAHYDNNTPGVSDGNELKLRFGGVHGSGLNKSGDFELDVSGMKTGGSRVGSSIADLENLKTAKHLKALITLDGNHQKEVISLDVDSETGKVIIPKDHPAANAIFGMEKGDGGTVSIKARFIEIAEVVTDNKGVPKTHSDGSNMYRVLATAVGKGNSEWRMSDAITSSPTPLAYNPMETPSPQFDALGRLGMESLPTPSPMPLAPNYVDPLVGDLSSLASESFFPTSSQYAEDIWRNSHLIAPFVRLPIRYDKFGFPIYDSYWDFWMAGNTNF